MSRDPSDNTDKRRWLAVNRPAQHAGVEGLVQEVAELRRRLEEAEETIRAIREDEVDAFVVSQGEADRVLTLVVRQI
jgi:hypothetical protein